VAEARRRGGRALGLILAAVVLAGCGYSTRGSLPDHIKTVAVPIFKNRTLQPGVDSAITSGVVNAFSSGGRVQFRDVRRSAMLWRQEGLQETSDFQVSGQVSDPIAQGQGAVLQAAAEIGRKAVNLAVDRF
jgi:hypothetical protein